MADLLSIDGYDDIRTKGRAYGTARAALHLHDASRMKTLAVELVFLQGNDFLRADRHTKATALTTFFIKFGFGHSVSLLW
jgi:hypothetical protein